MRALEKPSSSMEEGWVVVWPLSMGERLCKAPAPNTAFSETPRIHHHPRPFLHRGGRERTVVRPDQAGIALDQRGSR